MKLNAIIDQHNHYPFLTNSSHDCCKTDHCDCDHANRGEGALANNCAHKDPPETPGTGGKVDKSKSYLYAHPHLPGGH